MNKQEKLNAINDCYITALSSGKVKNRKEFAELLGINASTLSAAFNGNEAYLTDNFVMRMASVAKSLEMQVMFPSIRKEEESEVNTQVTIPVIPIEAMAGTLGDFSLCASAYECEHMVSPIKGADYAMKVSGDSMSPEYPNGSLILIKRINEKAFIEWGKVYVLDTANGAVIKQIRKTEKEGVIECVSLNPDFQPFTIDTSYINGWYRVLMVLALK